VVGVDGAIGQNQDAGAGADGCLGLATERLDRLRQPGRPAGGGEGRSQVSDAEGGIAGGQDRLELIGR